MSVKYWRLIKSAWLNLRRKRALKRRRKTKVKSNKRIQSLNQKFQKRVVNQSYWSK